MLDENPIIKKDFRLRPINEWNLRLTKLIMHEIPFGFFSAIITGERRKGKSIYAMKVIALLYHLQMSWAEEECWKKAFECFIFGPDDLTAKVRHNTDHHLISPVWCLDDTTVHFGTMLFFINPYQLQLLNGIFDTIGTAVNALLLTCPNKKRLMNALKNYDDTTIQVVKAREGGWERIARGISWFTIPDGRQKFRKIFEDHYSCYAPDYIYKPYLEKRESYLKQQNDLLIKLMDRLRNKNEIKEEKEEAATYLQNEINTQLMETNNEINNLEEYGEGTA